MSPFDTHDSLNIECPCCHGQKFLFQYDEAEPNREPVKVYCCHCGGNGVIAPDNRSTNAHE